MSSLSTPDIHDCTGHDEVAFPTDITPQGNGAGVGGRKPQDRQTARARTCKSVHGHPGIWCRKKEGEGRKMN